MTSGDGIHWQERANISLGGEDGTSLLYNPFRKKWILALKSQPTGIGRCKRYIEADGFDDLANRNLYDSVFWVRSDKLDDPDPQINQMCQLYMVEMAGYESILLGVFLIWYGPNNAT